MASNVITSLFVLVLVPLQSTQPMQPSQPSQPSQTWPEELRGISINWITSNLRSASREAELLIYAYDLDPEVLPAFWHEFYSVWAEEYHYEMAYFRQNNEGKSEAVLLQELRDFSARMPLGPKRLLLLVESLLEPRDFTDERRRCEELRYRRDQRTWINEDQTIRRDQLIRQAKRSRRLRIARLTDRGHPMPLWVYARRKREEELRQAKELDAGELKKRTVRRKSRWVPGGMAVRRQAVTSTPDEPTDKKKHRSSLPALSPRGHQQTLAAPSAADSPAYSELRAQWTDYLQSFSRQRALNDGQRQQAEGILSAMWVRAMDYRQLRQAEYDEIETLSSRNEYADRRSRLDVPLQNLFEEFKLRLEAIPRDRSSSTNG